MTKEEREDFRNRARQSTDRDGLGFIVNRLLAEYDAMEAENESLKAEIGILTELKEDERSWPAHAMATIDRQEQEIAKLKAAARELMRYGSKPMGPRSSYWQAWKALEELL